MNKINIIYFIWINPKKNFKNIISGQLSDIKNSGILNESKIYIEICCDYEEFCDDLKKLINNIIKEYNYEIQFYSKNVYEYYGIKKLYDLAQIEPDKYYLYIHSKGMFNYDNIDDRHNYEKTLTKGTVYQYKKVVKIFDDNSNIAKIGLFPSENHNKNFIWLNFFWARGVYLTTCENPIKTNDRYYYELWSGTGESVSLTYNLHENNYKKYQLHFVGDTLNRLKGEYFLPNDLST